MQSPYYISLSGKYGSPMADYLSMEDLLKDMDRLGIWQTTATCLRGNTLLSNRDLLRDIEETPGAKGRVIPAFYAEPYIFVSNGELEHLVQAFRDHHPACLRLNPKTSQYRLREMERVLEALEEFAPVVLVEKEELVDPYDLDDMIYLAQRFPKMKFVIQRVIWGFMHWVFDAMLRCENIYMDTSWLHFEGGHVTMCKHFGPERLIFSLGQPAICGAAIGGLCYAEIPQEQKDAIASDNFIALFQKEEDREYLRANRRSIENHVGNSYWNDFLAQKPPRSLVIDAHAHITPHTSQWLSPTNDIVEQRDTLLHNMERLGIQTTFVSNTHRLQFDALKPNADLLRITEGYTDKIRGYLCFIANRPEGYTDEYLDKMFATGFFVGFKSLPDYNKVCLMDERYDVMFDYANRHSLPILLHAWESPLCNVDMIAQRAAQYPNTRIIIGHSSGNDIGRRNCEKIAQDPRYDNVYFEFCGTFKQTIRWPESLQKIDYHRFIFGTDTHCHDAAWEMARLLSEEIPDEQLKEILGGNAVRVLEL